MNTDKIYEVILTGCELKLLKDLLNGDSIENVDAMTLHHLKDAIKSAKDTSE